MWRAPAARAPWSSTSPRTSNSPRGFYTGLTNSQHKSYRPQMDGDERAVAAAVELIANAKRPIFYTGGGIINSGPEASSGCASSCA